MMNPAKVGLLINAVGCVILGLCSFQGTSTVWGGEHRPKGNLWKWAGRIGWGFLIVGFGVQYFALN